MDEEILRWIHNNPDDNWCGHWMLHGKLPIFRPYTYVEIRIQPLFSVIPRTTRFFAIQQMFTDEALMSSEKRDKWFRLLKTLLFWPTRHLSNYNLLPTPGWKLSPDSPRQSWGNLSMPSHHIHHLNCLPNSDNSTCYNWSTWIKFYYSWRIKLLLKNQTLTNDPST